MDQALKSVQRQKSEGPLVWVHRWALLAFTVLIALVIAGGPVAFAEDPSNADLLPIFGAAAPKDLHPAPDFNLADLQGKPVALSDFSGKVVLLNFWATWCKPCVKEMPSIEALWRLLGDKGLTVVGINSDRGRRRAVERFVASHGLTFPVVIDPRGKVRGRFRVAALPVTFLVDQQGNMLAQVIGERVWDAPEVVSALQALLETTENTHD